MTVYLIRASFPRIVFAMRSDLGYIYLRGSQGATVFLSNILFPGRHPDILHLRRFV